MSSAMRRASSVRGSGTLVQSFQRGNAAANLSALEGERDFADPVNQRAGSDPRNEEHD